MGIVKLDQVISYSSQDDVFCAENILRRSPLRPWLCARRDKSGRLEAEFQLEKASYIHFIDLGNFGSSTVEIQVSRSGFGEKEYTSFLPATTLLSLSKVKEGEERHAVYMFNEFNFNKDAIKEKWSKIKVVCCQPFNKKYQFGLRFLSLRNKPCKSPPPEGASSGDQNESNDGKTALIILPPISQDDEKSDSVHQPPVIYLRQDIEKKTKREMNSKPVKIIMSTPFLLEAVSFLIACQTELDDETVTEYIKEFQSQRGQRLSHSETKTFIKLYFKMFHENYAIMLRNPTDHSGKSEVSFEVTKEKGVKRQKTSEEVDETKGLQDRNNNSDELFQKQASSTVSSYLQSQKSECSEFSLQDIAPYSRPQEFIQCDGAVASTSKNMYGPKDFIQHDGAIPSTSKTRPTDFIQHDGAIPSTSKARPEDFNQFDGAIPSTSKTMPEDFNQFDGAIPSTSKAMPQDFNQFDGATPSTSGGITYVECPICTEAYPNFEIEMHAATCGDYQQYSLDEVQIVKEQLINAGEQSAVEPEVLIVEDNNITTAAAAAATVTVATAAAAAATATNDDELAACPICEAYPNFDIERHAATCGDYQQYSLDEVQIVKEQVINAGEQSAIEPEVLIVEDDNITTAAAAAATVTVATATNDDEMAGCPICEAHPNFEIKRHGATGGDYQQYSLNEVQIVTKQLINAGEQSAVEPEVLIVEDDNITTAAAATVTVATAAAAAATATDDDELAACPICGILVPILNLKMHYDFCVCFH